MEIYKQKKKKKSYIQEENKSEINEQFGMRINGDLQGNKIKKNQENLPRIMNKD